MRQGQFGGFYEKFNKFQYTKIHIIIAVKWVFSLSEYIKIDVGWGFAPDPTGGAYSAPQTLAGFKGADSRQDGNRGEGRWDVKGEMGKGGEGGTWGSWDE